MKKVRGMKVVTQEQDAKDPVDKCVGDYCASKVFECSDLHDAERAEIIEKKRGF